MADNTYAYLILDGKTVRVGASVKLALELYVRCGDAKRAAKDAKIANFAAVLKRPAIQKWIERKREFAATKEDFNDDEYFTFLIRSIRGMESEMDSKAFGKRLRAAEIYGRGKGMGGSEDIGTIKFVLPGQSSGVQAKPESS